MEFVIRISKMIKSVTGFFLLVMLIPVILNSAASVVPSPNLQGEQDEEANINVEPEFYLYVSSRGTNSIKLYNGDTGAFIRDVVPANANGLNTPQEVLISPDDQLYVTGRMNKAVLKFDRNTGQSLGSFTSGYALREPTKTTVADDGSMYISQWQDQKQKVVKFDSEGVFVREWTDIELFQGMEHTWDSAGNMYVASFGSHDVKKIDADGKFLGVFVKPEFLSGAVNLWFGKENNLYVADWNVGKVKIFDGTTGNYVSDFVTGLTRVEGKAIGPNGSLFLCDWQKNTINEYDADTGEFIRVFVNDGGLVNPNSIVFARNPNK